MTDLKLSSGLRLVLDRAASEAKRHGHGTVSPLHLILAVNRGRESAFTPQQVQTTEESLKSIPPNYEPPVPSTETNALLAAAAEAERDQLEALVELLQQYIARLPAAESAHDNVERSERAERTPDTEGVVGESADGTAATAEEGPGTKGSLPNQLRRVLAEAPSGQLSVPRAGTVHRILAMLGARQPQPVLLVGTEGSGRTAVAQAIAAAVHEPGYAGPLAGSPVWITQAARIGDQPQQLMGPRRSPASTSSSSTTSNC